MKKSIMSFALLALMTTGLAYADTTTSPTPRHPERWVVNCSYGSTGITANARIVFDGTTATIEDATTTAGPQWYGTLLAVFDKGVLISASDATLYRLTGDPHFNWDLDNADATVHVLFEDHPFHGAGPNSVNSEIRIDHSSDVGTCMFTRI